MIVAALTLPALAGCTLLGGGGGSPAVSDIQGVKDATMLIVGQGTYVEPLTLDPAENAWIGTGWFITSDGYAVTNNHVVSGAGSLKVYLGGDQNEARNAQVISASECYDLAVIKVDTEGAAAPRLAWFEGDITEGVEVYSAGYPGVLGAEYTLTKGIVSQADGAEPTQWADVEHAIQHDARIRGGNSGGPLVDESGHVIGVNYAGSDESDSNIAIGRETARTAVEKLMSGEVLLSLGLNTQALPPADNGAPQGIWIQSVLPGGPADKAGVKPGDVLEKLNGVSMGESGVLRGYCDVLRTNGIDATMTAQVYRPATGEVLEGQINGTPLAVTGTTGGNGNGGDQPVGGFVDITDDTNSLTLQVPDTWSQVDGQPFTDSGVTWASLTASPDINGFDNSLTVPGVSFYAAPPGTIDPAGYVAGIDSQAASVCTPQAQSQPWADGYSTGVYSYYTGCGGGTTDYAVIGANLDDGSAVITLTVQMVSDFDKNQALQKILESYFAVL
ncbi:MAG: serine protease [Actinomycetales bacterium]|nr:serine protease [Actinomycetales bacterium]